MERNTGCRMDNLIMTTFDKLAARIESDTGLKLTGFRRTYAGYFSLAAGAWKWAAYKEGGGDIGSQYTAGELLKSKKKLIIYRPGFPFMPEINIDE